MAKECSVISNLKVTLTNSEGNKLLSAYLFTAGCADSATIAYNLPENISASKHFFVVQLPFWPERPNVQLQLHVFIIFFNVMSQESGSSPEK